MNDKKGRDGGPKKVSGVLMVTRSGKGFLLQEEKDIPVLKGALGGALNGDIVEVSVSRGRFEMIGRVERVIERKTNRFVGEVKEMDGKIVLVPDDSRVYFTFLLTDSAVSSLGNKVVVEVSDWGKDLPHATITETIGKAGEHETEIQAIIASRGIESTFTEAVLKEAQSLYDHAWDENEIQKREDFRSTLTFTIDPDTAKDFDDAISYKELPDGDIEVGVHIADVSHFVTPGSLMDREAYKRATSVYLVDRTIPMLPPQLSEDLCSLKPDIDRLTFSAVFRINPQNEVVDRRFTKGIIRSQKRFTYEEADVSLTDTTGPLHTELARLWNFADHLRKGRRKAGAIMFDNVEIRPVLNEAGETVSFKHSEYTDSHKLIEELMLLANREVATFVSNKLGKKNRLFIYRTHDTPNEEKIEDLSLFLRVIGYQLLLPGRSKKVSGQDINRLLDQIEGTPEERLIKTATVRSMAKALYTTKNVGHYGLAFEYYAHFTSPIRRYPDLMVHRTLFKIISGKPVDDDPHVVEQQANHASEREVLASQAERESIKMKQVEYFEKLIGQTREGVVSGVTEWGIYIEDKETGGEGMARLATLTDDTYEYDPRKFAAVGINTKNVIRLGDPVTFIVEKVDVRERQIDLRLVIQ